MRKKKDIPKKAGHAKHPSFASLKKSGTTLHAGMITPAHANAKVPPAAHEKPAAHDKSEMVEEKRRHHELEMRVKTAKKSSESLEKSYGTSIGHQRKAGFDGFSGFVEMLNAAGKLGENLADAISSSMESFVVLAKKGTLTAGQAFRMLGKALLKAALQTIAQTMLIQSITDLATGAMLALGIYTEGQAIEYLLAGAIEGAAAGIFFGISAAFLAEGGMVTRPTLAMLGDGGEPELVLPQNKMGMANMGFSIQAQELQAHFPDVTDPKAAQHPAFIRKFQESLQAAMTSAANGAA